MTGAPAARRCPTCGRPAVEAFRPFCTARCADVDLHRWLSGGYIIQSGGEDDIEERSPSGLQRLGGAEDEENP